MRWRYLYYAVLCSMMLGGYQQVRLDFPASDIIPQLQSLGMDLEGMQYRPGVFIEFNVSDTELDLLLSSGLNPTVLIPDLETYYASRLTSDWTREFGLGSMGGYYTLEEAIDRLDSLRAQYPQLISEKLDIGISYEGRPVYAVCISDNADVDEGEPEVLYTGLHHAREGASIMTVFYFMYELLDNYGTDPEITALVDHRQMWFIPCVNPDGYEYNRMIAPNGGGMQRKNRHPECPISQWTGVDLNRNYDYSWAYDDSGSDPDPCGTTYRGTAGFSEPETQIIRDFVLDHNFRLALNYHTYGNWFIFPTGANPYEFPPEEDLAIMFDFAVDMCQYNGYVYGNASETVNYVVNGESDSWMYNIADVFAFTPEVGSSGDGYWASIDRIVPLAQEHVYPNKMAAWFAGAQYSANLEFSSTTFIPGETYSLDVFVVNRGRGDGLSLVEVDLYSSDVEYLDYSPQQIPGVTSRDTTTVVTGVTFTVPADAGNGSFIEFETVLIDDQGFPFQNSFTITVGQPLVIFADGAEDGMGNWVSEGWGFTTHSWAGTYAFADSPQGNYANLTTHTLTIAEPVDLSSSVMAIMTYMANWEIENGWDFAQVMASTDGSNWTSLQGAYMHLGTGNGEQQNDEYGYDGTTDWVFDSVSLGDFVGESQVWVRFQMSSDNYVTGDGFNVDDIQIVHYTASLPDGDVNDDGLLNVLDVVRIVAIILGEPPTPTETELMASDINQDGVVNISDIVIIVGYIMAG